MNNFFKTLAAGLTLSLFCMVSPVSATFVNFSYEFSDGALLEGSFEGMLEPDNDTFIGVTNVMATLDGADMDISAWSKIGGGGQEIFSLSGAAVNIFARNATSDKIFQLSTFGNLLGYGVNGFSFDHFQETFDQSKWSATGETAVPEPSTYLLMGSCLAIASLACKRKKALANV